MVVALQSNDGKLADNIVHFARALRKAGVKVGTSQVSNAISAIQVAGFTRREDFYYALRATLICRPEHIQTFQQVFQMFWRDPEFLERMVRSMLPLLQVMEPEKPPAKAAQRRAAEALWDQEQELREPRERNELEIDAQFSWSDNVVLREMDFEQMSAAELADAAIAIRSLKLPVDPVRTRRFRPSVAGRSPDIRAILRRSLRKGGEFDQLSFRAPRRRPPDLVAICDISGSMSVYSRMMMHFLHALTWAPNSGWGKVRSFTFGTELTNITRALHRADVDLALEAVSNEAPDWQGGTRIGDALKSFNRHWSRRVFGQGAVVLLFTDGLERGDISLLRAEAERLSRSCRRLIWLNPLLRWEQFSPLAAGVRALLPVVDSFHACHSLNSLSDLSATLQTAANKDKFSGSTTLREPIRS
ncbi:MAG: vWA domain-containing protein [Boseongicola sp.]